MAKLIPDALSIWEIVLLCGCMATFICLMDCLFEKAVAGKFQDYSISAMRFYVLRFAPEVVNLTLDKLERAIRHFA